MFNQIGPLEIGLVLLIVLVIFGPKRLPGLGKSLGTGMREFKESITGKDVARDDAADERPAITEAPPVTPPATQPVPDAEQAAAGSGPGADKPA